ncbi:hypothetical protein WJX84_006679, partial [Apatococcus fuscideae]
AVGVLQLALSEGYTRALRVHAQDVDGLLGTGEVQLQLGRLTGADRAAAKACFDAATQAYERALQAPEKLGKLQDRSKTADLKWL